MLLPSLVTVGTLSNTSLIPSLVATLTGSVVGSLGDSAGSALGMLSARIQDSIAFPLADNFSRWHNTGIVFSPAATSDYSVFPVLVTCDGREVPQVRMFCWIPKSCLVLFPFHEPWTLNLMLYSPSLPSSLSPFLSLSLIAPQAYFAAASPALDRCLSLRIPIASESLVRTAAGTSSFDGYKPYVVSDNASDVLASVNVDLSVDRRLLLWGAPTGCYRFRFVYAPTGGGNLASRAVFRSLVNAPAVSVGASRPFRYLSPVKTVVPLPMPQQTVAGDAILPLQPSVTLFVRDNPALNGTSAFVDDCEIVLESDPAAQAQLRRVQRCPNAPHGGLVVTVSAVSASTLLEYSVYVEGLLVDCARAAANATASGLVYTAMFSGVRLPSLTSLPPGTVPGLVPLTSDGTSPAASGASLPPGDYYLKFTSYATSALSPYKIVLAANPNELSVAVVDPSSRVYSGPLRYAVSGNGAVWDLSDGTPLVQAVMATPLAPIGLLVSVAGVPMPGTLVTASLADGPINANAQLSTVGSLQAANDSGVALFQAILTSGMPGVYAFVFRVSSGVPCNASQHVVRVNLTNPARVALATVGGTPFGAASTPSAPLRVVIGAALPPLRVCFADMSGNVSRIAGASIVLRTYLNTGLVSPLSDPDPVTLAPPQQLYSTVQGAQAAATALRDALGLSAPPPVVDECAVGLVDGRSPVTVGASTSTTWQAGPDGCVTASGLVLHGGSGGGSVSIRLQFSMTGVDTPPLYVHVSPNSVLVRLAPQTLAPGCRLPVAHTTGRESCFS